MKRKTEPKEYENHQNKSNNCIINILFWQAIDATNYDPVYSPWQEKRRQQRAVVGSRMISSNLRSFGFLLQCPHLSAPEPHQRTAEAAPATL
jgi:hypothetical protein